MSFSFRQNKHPRDTYFGHRMSVVSRRGWRAGCTETAVLQNCRIIDFDVLEYKGGGCNGAVFLARCNNNNRHNVVQPRTKSAERLPASDNSKTRKPVDPVNEVVSHSATRALAGNLKAQHTAILAPK